MSTGRSRRSSTASTKSTRGQRLRGEPRAWSRIGGGLDGPGEGPINRFAGTLGAVVIVPAVVDTADVGRLQAWAQGRFGAP
jgi:hypothetical protein